VVKFAAAGTQVEAAPCGVRLVLVNPGRKIAYSSLQVRDANDKELPLALKLNPQQGRRRLSVCRR